MKINEYININWLILNHVRDERLHPDKVSKSTITKFMKSTYIPCKQMYNIFWRYISLEFRAIYLNE